MSQEIYDKDDNYDKVNTDTLLLMNRVDIVKDKIDKLHGTVSELL